MRIKTSKQERETITTQIANIKADIQAMQKDRLEDQHHLLKQKNQLIMLLQTSKENRNETQQLKKKTETGPNFITPS